MENAAIIRAFSVLVVFAGLCAVPASAATKPAVDAWAVLGANSAGADTVLHAFAWPESGRRSKAKVKVAELRDAAGRPSEVRVDYSFPDAACLQVVVDIPLIGGRCYSALTFGLKGDGTPNRIEAWLGAGGRWFGLGRQSLKATSRTVLTVKIDETDTDIADTLRFCIVQAGGFGSHTVFLDDIRFIRPVEPRVKDLHVFGKDIPAAIHTLPARPCAFRMQIERNADRNALLLDGKPLFCVLDARQDATYLNAAREAGVNAFALDLYWRNIEPRKGYREWDRLLERIDELGRLGFGVFLMLGPHQPLWWRLEHPDLPGARTGTAYVLNPAVMDDFGKIVHELVTITSPKPNVLGYMVSAGGEQDTSFCGPTDDPVCLAHFRTWLRKRYDSVAALRRAWNDPGVQFATAVPPGRSDKPDFSGAHRDWAAFTTGWWVDYANRVAAMVRPFAPDKLLVARFGWPVFQSENLFLSRLADVDLIQCKDAVAAWEVGHPGKQLSRTALYFGALRHSNQIVFPEMDIVHGRGYHAGDLSRYVPLFGRFAGALWYYRGMMMDRPGFREDFADAVAEGKRLVTARLGPARAGVFYSVAWASEISVQRDYGNENALVGVAELLRDLDVRGAAVSEFTLPDLFDCNVVFVPENPAISREAETVLKAYVALGGAVVMEANTGEFDLSGRRRPRGTPEFVPFRKSGTRHTGKRLVFSLRGLGLSGTLSLPGPTHEIGTVEPNAEVVAQGAETAIVRSGPVLYIPCRFFAPYSYDAEADKSGMCGLIAAFLADVEADQARTARHLVAQARREGQGEDAMRLTILADAALADRLYIRAGFLARLSLAVGSDRLVPEGRIPATRSLLRSQRAWIAACRHRIGQSLKRLDAVPDVRAALRRADAVPRSSQEQAGANDPSPERVLARSVLALDELLEIERRLKNRSFIAP